MRVRDWQSECYLDSIHKSCDVFMAPPQKLPAGKENSWEHRKTAQNIAKQLRTSETSKIIWYHPKNNWGLIIDDLVQFEEDFNSRKTSSENSRKTSENSWEHWKTSKIIWYHPENNWGPIIDNLVQFEEDFNSRTKKLRSGGVDWIGYLRPVQFLDHLTVIKTFRPWQTCGWSNCLKLSHNISI